MPYLISLSMNAEYFKQKKDLQFCYALSVIDQKNLVYINLSMRPVDQEEIAQRRLIMMT